MASQKKEVRPTPPNTINVQGEQTEVTENNSVTQASVSNSEQNGLEIGAVESSNGLMPKVQELKAETFTRATIDFVNDNTTSNLFPVDAYPKKIQNIIYKTNEFLNFPIDYISSSILFAASVAIGNTYSLQNATYSSKAVLYLALVGDRGISKTHPLTFALKPLIDADAAGYRAYQEQKKQYDYIQSLPKKGKKDEEYEEASSTPPFWKQYLIDNSTQEATLQALKNNRRGIGVDADELEGWFGNFNRYTSGNDESSWLSSWSNEPFRVNRVSKEPVFIPEPFISVAGTIQEEVLQNMAKGRLSNGFFDRFLFSVPKGLKKPSWNRKALPPNIPIEWRDVLNRILAVPLQYDKNVNPKPRELHFSDKAFELYYEFQNELRILPHQIRGKALKGMCAKLEMYGCRLALILQLLYWACGEDNNVEVGEKATAGAIKMTRHFLKNSIEANRLAIEGDPIGNLTENQLKLFDALPNSFPTAKGVEITEDLKIDKRTFYRLMKNLELFQKAKYGHYEKIF